MMIEIQTVNNGLIFFDHVFQKVHEKCEKTLSEARNFKSILYVYSSSIISHLKCHF